MTLMARTLAIVGVVALLAGCLDANRPLSPVAMTQQNGSYEFSLGCPRQVTAVSVIADGDVVWAIESEDPGGAFLELFSFEEVPDGFRLVTLDEERITTMERFRVEVSGVPGLAMTFVAKQGTSNWVYWEHTDGSSYGEYLEWVRSPNALPDDPCPG